MQLVNHSHNTRRNHQLPRQDGSVSRHENSHEASSPTARCASGKTASRVNFVIPLGLSQVGGGSASWSDLDGGSQVGGQNSWLQGKTQGFRGKGFGRLWVLANQELLGPVGETCPSQPRAAALKLSRGGANIATGRRS